MISIDITLFFQLFNFLLTIAVLNWLLIGPIRDILAKRRDRMAALKGTADSFHHEADALLASYEARLAEARIEAGKIRDAAKQAAQSGANSFMEKAQTQARQVRADNDAQVEKEGVQALTDLRKEVGRLANLGIAKVLA